jgi:prepilin-type N-terminal cleavage/methylation domain-containing protein
MLVNNKRKSGFALTEVLMAIAVILIIGIGGYQLYATSRENAEVNGLINGMADLKTNLDKSLPSNQSYMFGQQNFNVGITQAGLVPSEFTPTGEFDSLVYNNLFSVGVVELDAGNSGGEVNATTNAQLLYELEANQSGGNDLMNSTMPSSTCIKVLKGMMQLFPNVWFGQNIQVNGTPVSNTIVTDACTTGNQQETYVAGIVEFTYPILGSDEPLATNQ